MTHRHLILYYIKVEQQEVSIVVLLRASLPMMSIEDMKI